MIKFVEALACAIARDLSEGPNLVEFAKTQIDEWQANVGQQADMPGWTVSTDGRLLDSATVGYMTFLTKSTGLCFICRSLCRSSGLCRCLLL